jgi:hypothetical protein
MQDNTINAQQGTQCPVNPPLRLTICTNVMNRLAHLKETYIQNLQVCQHLTNVDFVLLNFNCQQDTHQWANSHLKPQIKSGQLNYFYEDTAKYFNMSKAKNLSHRLAQGELLMNLDADNFLDINAINQILAAFSTDNKKIACGKKNMCGLLIVKKSDFYKVNGYDETMTGWGYEERDLFTRITQHCGYRWSEVGLLNRLQKIRHGHTLRLMNMDLQNRRDPHISNNLNRQKSNKNISDANYVAAAFQPYAVYKNFATTALPVAAIHSGEQGPD